MILQGPRKIIESEHLLFFLKKMKEGKGADYIYDEFCKMENFKVSRTGVFQLYKSIKLNGGPDAVIENHKKNILLVKDIINKNMPDNKIGIIARRMKLLDEIRDRINKIKTEQTAEINAKKEAVLSGYYSLTHDIYKYFEAFLIKYEIHDLLEKLSIEIARNAVEIFLYYISKEKHSEVLAKFKESLNITLDIIIKNDLKLEE